MPPRADTEDYHSLFLADIPLMDMRAPAEFGQGAFPAARSLPLMTDEERAQVGTCYKQRGQQAAIALGYELVAGEQRERRLAGWCQFARRHPDGYLYCFRGGLRSQTVQQWLHDAGIDYPLVKGGYKAMRRFLLNQLEHAVTEAEFVLVCGQTGTGKTRVISQLPRSIDLEGLAGHRGSTFGELPQPQPSQIDFENALSIALLKKSVSGKGCIYLEDEGQLIGRLHLPAALRDKMKSSAMIVVEQSLAQRIDVVVEDYIVDLGRRYNELHGHSGPGRLRDKLQADLGRIRKRLGGARSQAVNALLNAAFEQQWRSGDLSLHRRWIEMLLQEYYDPMYEYQLAQRGGRELFRGDRAAVIDWVVGRS